MSATLHPAHLTPSDLEMMRALLDALDGPAAHNSATLTVGSRKSLPLPQPTLGLVTELLKHLVAGRSVTVLTGEEEISPREAAELLAVSRPFAARLFDNGQIPSRRVGTHRRAYVRDVLAYLDRQQAARLAALDELTAQGQQLNPGH